MRERATMEAAVVAAAAVAASGCDAEPEVASTPESRATVRFLLRAQFSASDAEIAAVQARGARAWLDGEFARPQGPSGWDWLHRHGYDVVRDATRYYDQYYPADHMVWAQLTSGPDPVRQRLAFALSNYFVVSTSSFDFPWRSHASAAWWDLLCEHAFGNFRTLLEHVTLSPAMGDYLNLRGNRRADPESGRVPDENFAREILQLFTIGLLALEPDGTPALGPEGRPRETYSNEDVTNLARVFTGWDLDETGSTRDEFVRGSTATDGRVANPLQLRNPMRLYPGRHAPEEKRFLGTVVPAGTDGATSLTIALDALFAHPNLPPFFARQMIQRLVTSDPDPGYVRRVARAFEDDGAGVRGDLKAVWRAILLDEEALGAGALDDPAWGRLREPIVRLVQWARTFGASSRSGRHELPDLSTALGQSPLRAPSVFNFFRPGYVPPQTAFAADGATAPEFQIVNESTVAAYLNFLQDAVRDGVRTAEGRPEVIADYASVRPLAGDPAALVERLNLLLCAGQLGAATVNTIRDAVASIPMSRHAGWRDRVAAAVFLVMAAPEYMAQK